ncbi:hypothetical protein [Apilactobacillus timberlakei]|uniref:hypothetical protein n=1 Tax=Apilactobacillus timberlakei TaxID=2008380 RepID=UPI00112C0DBC|nr:hypothetical protein [Apilactobacillus timberlakei]TPR13204.1 hypothetical protein DYZ97_04775 [Apilactobacillus timberlakei]
MIIAIPVSFMIGLSLYNINQDLGDVILLTIAWILILTSIACSILDAVLIYRYHKNHFFFNLGLFIGVIGGLLPLSFFIFVEFYSNAPDILGILTLFVFSAFIMLLVAGLSVLGKIHRIKP